MGKMGITLNTHIAGTVAAMTESEPDVESEKASYNIFGQPGSAPKAFGVGYLVAPKSSVGGSV
jgi:hypothetical protein